MSYKSVIFPQCQLVSKFSAISWQEQVTLWRDDYGICFVLGKHVRVGILKY